MPAIELTRLKKQADELASKFHQPEVFLRLFIDLLEFYADRLTRPGLMAKPAPLIPKFGVPELFLQAVVQALQTPSFDDPDAALSLVRVLWTDKHLEPRLLAASLIGMAAPHRPEESAELLVQFCVASENPLVQEALLERSGLQLRAANWKVWIELVERWIVSSDITQQIIGFKALRGVIDDRDFENLPVIYRLLTNPLETVNRTTNHELEILITQLARRSPVETAYLLRQCHTRAGNPVLSRLLRKVLPNFPIENQKSLKNALQDMEKT
jgi:hypothetical protein